MSAVAALFLSITGFFFGLGQVIDYSAPLTTTLHSQATVLIGGDMMFDRTVRTAIEAQGGNYLFSCLDPLFFKADLVMANLEGPITASDSTSTGSKIGDGRNFIFTFATGTAPLLANHHVGLVNLGNNHILNFGWKGLRTTIDLLTASGVGYFGDPKSDHVVEMRVRGIPIAFINYNQFSPPPWNASTTVAHIRAERAKGYLPVIYPHWGIEYETATTSQKILAHQFIDAGAEIVIGSHPHVVQEHEVYRGKYIYYSLGNLIFDQYWSDAVTHGLLLSLSVNQEGISKVEEIPVILGHDRRTCPQVSAM